MQQFLEETQAFVRLIQQNEIYREELSRITTVPNYFESIAAPTGNIKVSDAVSEQSH